MANFGAFIYMNARDIGLTIDTIPVISLGIGLGVDYGIYTVARIQDEVMGGASVDNAITTALRSTGAAGLQHFRCDDRRHFAVGLLAAAVPQRDERAADFSDGTNMIAGVLILPAYIAWRRPRFVTRYEIPPGDATSAVAG